MNSLSLAPWQLCICRVRTREIPLLKMQATLDDPDGRLIIGEESLPC
jgi:hypothetical protein